ncbi:MAG: tetratricopeptide repeat protein [Solibacteraceae bacterium]|nr:tetratricopeptide repeat protein [Solibacteraceae bacterium]
MMRCPCGLPSSFSRAIARRPPRRSPILQTLIGREPRNAVIRYNLARAHQSRGELDAARVQFAEAVKIKDDFVAAHIGLGQVSLLKRDFGSAIESAERALKIDSANLAAKVVKINALINNNNLRQARSDLDAFMRQNPDSPDLQFQLALVNFQENRFADAENSFRDLRSALPCRSAAHLRHCRSVYAHEPSERSPSVSSTGAVEVAKRWA